jgi:pilus assembly protein CpaF
MNPPGRPATTVPDHVHEPNHLHEQGLVRSLQALVADRMTGARQRRERDGERPLGPADERQLALSLARQAVADHLKGRIAAGQAPPDPSYDRSLVEAIDAAMFGAGALQELLDDADVENVDINGCDEVWVTYADNRGTVRARPVAATDEELIEVVRTLGSYAGLNARPFTPVTPQLDLRLPDGSRLSAVMTASERPLVSVRRNRYPQMFLTHPSPTRPVADSGHNTGSGPGSASGPDGRRQTLVKLETIDEQLASFLQAAVLARCNIMVAGATDAGKTTLLRALINCIPPDERLVTVERALELGLRRQGLHPNVAELEEVLGSTDGGGALSIRDLVRRTRRMNPSRVIVGEVLGPEVVEMLSAMSQGNNGSLSTIHARSADDVYDRLATYATQYEGLPFEVTHALIGAAIDLVVYIAKNPLAGGRRTVTEVLEVTGSNDGRVTRSTIFARSPANGCARRDPEVAITRIGDLRAAGYDDAPGWAPRTPGYDAPYVARNGTHRDIGSGRPGGRW